MKEKNERLATLKMLISSHELSSQHEVLQALRKEGYNVTQATLSRDFKQLKVAKAASMNGEYVYVLPNETMYRPGFISIHFSGNMGVIKTRPGYASSLAYNIDNADFPEILGTIAGDDTIFIVIDEKSNPEELEVNLNDILNFM